MSLSGLQLIVVVGKGGVGRSTASVALGLHAASQGRRVLVVDTVAAGGTAQAFACSQPVPVGQVIDPTTDTDADTGTDIGSRGRVGLLELDTKASLDEFVRLNLKVPIAPRSLTPIARMFDYVATAAPAVREMLTIGKIGHEVRHGPWDLVVVDGPATGHVVELLSAPRVLREMTTVGPLASETVWISELLADRERSAAIAVTLAEELPVTEMLELLGRLDKEADIGLAGLIVNRRATVLSAEGIDEAKVLIGQGGPLAAPAEIAVNRHVVAERELARIAAVGAPTITVPEDLDEPVAAVRSALEQAGW